MTRTVFGIFLFLAMVSQADAPVEMGQANIRRLEQDLHMLQQFVYKRFGGDQDYHEAGLVPPDKGEEPHLEHLQQLEASLASVTGNLEEMRHAMKMQQEEINLLKEHNRKLEDKFGTLHVKFSSQEKAAFDNRLQSMTEDAFILFLDTELQLMSEIEKEKALQTFIKRFPNHEKTPQLLKDLIYMTYKQRKYKDTARFAGAFYKKTPDAPEAAEILLMLAYSLHHLDKPKEACTTLQKINASYKDISLSLKQRVSDAEKEYQCVSTQIRDTQPST